MIPIRTDYRMTRTPWINYALVASNVIIFLLINNTTHARQIRPWLLHPDNPQLYQFFSCMFLHAGWGHLLGNMVFLWVFGNALNDRFGQVGYLAFYLAGGITAGVGYMVLSGDAPVLGASGAISAVTGAYLVLFPRVRVTVLLFLFYFMTPMEVSSLFFLLVQFLFNLYMTMPTGSGGGVAYSAHSAGYVFGIVIAAGLLALRLLPRDDFDLVSLIQHYRRRSKFRRMAARGYDPFNPVGGSRRKGPSLRRKVRSSAVVTEDINSPASRELQLRREISEACSGHNLPVAAEKYLQLIQITSDAVLPRPQQLDVANQLMASDQHAAAADAYERFLKHYSNYEHLADIHLMLGLLYCRYLHQYDRAEKMLTQAVDALDDPKKIEMARGDLRRIRADKSP